MEFTTQRNGECPLCREIQSGHFVDPLVLPAGGCMNRLVLEADLTVMLPSLGPLTRHHMLVLPKDHYPSLLRCPLEVRNEMLRVVDWWLRTLRTGPGRHGVVFEHGACDDGTGNCGVTHCHLHVVESTRSFLPSGVKWRRLQPEQLHAQDHSGRSYLLFSPEPDCWYYSEDAAPSQFLRKQVARLLGIKDWDWRAEPNYPGMWQAYECARKLVQAHGTPAAVTVDAA